MQIILSLIHFKCLSLLLLHFIELIRTLVKKSKQVPFQKVSPSPVEVPAATQEVKAATQEVTATTQEVTAEPSGKMSFFPSSPIMVMKNFFLNAIAGNAVEMSGSQTKVYQDTEVTRDEDHGVSPANDAAGEVEGMTEDDVALKVQEDEEAPNVSSPLPVDEEEKSADSDGGGSGEEDNDE